MKTVKKEWSKNKRKCLVTYDNGCKEKFTYRANDIKNPSTITGYNAGGYYHHFVRYDKNGNVIESSNC